MADIVLLQVLQHLRPAWEFFQQGGVSPRGVHLEVRVDHIRVPLKAHLVVAAACSAMGENGTALLLHGQQQATGGHNPPNTSGLPVASIVHRHASYAFESALRDVVLEVDHCRLHSARRHLLDHVTDVILIRLANVSGEALDLYPGQPQTQRHRLGVQAAADTDAHHVAVLHIPLQNLGLLRAVGHGGQTSRSEQQRPRERGIDAGLATA
mmetsp:Transcript_80617/g.210305  ORF Transcript_80617/g.210305 Transcript_80617/m.210305 type:complete len:210 (-) Transcript_80617:5-634(-)